MLRAVRSAAFLLSIPLSILLPAAVWAGDEDPYLWLEEVEAPKALAWASERSAADTAVLEAVPEFEALHREMLEIYNSSDRIPTPRIRGEWVYNFWRDAEHVRGIWRRTSLEEFTKETPEWETVLDLDTLAEKEGENWVWKGASCLPPEERLCMIALSRGGADAAEEREFDTVAKSFVDGGFRLEEAKSFLSWKDEDTLWIGTDRGEGSLTTSGYPRRVEEWKRGTPLEEAPTIFEAGAEDVYAAGRPPKAATTSFCWCRSSSVRATGSVSAAGWSISTCRTTSTCGASSRTAW